MKTGVKMTLFERGWRKMFNGMPTSNQQEARDILIKEILEDCKKLSKSKCNFKKARILKQIERKVAICNT